ncbi:MAG TPA: hypothetical protein VE593_07745 [Nitrososphaeraceae archaeon]|nr:hypothetical protein [Nitrososphaeraceae archaeon]
MNIKFGELALLFTFGILFSALCSNVVVYAQNKTATSITAPAPSTNPEQHITKIKIISPSKGQQVSVGKDLTISGISIDNTTASSTDCKVSVIANKVRPYQPTTATGPGGAADYSKWNFVLTSKYTTIKPGENRITAKYECANNAALTSFSSVNVTGVPSAATNTTNSTTITGASSTITNPSTTTTTTTTTTKPNATSVAQAHTTTTGVATTQQQHPVTTNSNNLASASNNAAVQRISPTSGVANKPLPITSSIAPQIKTLNQQPHQQMQQVATVSNKTDVQNSKLASPSPVIASDKLMYLGYHDRGIADNSDSQDKNTMGTKSVGTRGSSSTSIDSGLTVQHKDRDISTSQVNVNRNTDNVNNNFIFPFSYP